MNEVHDPSGADWYCRIAGRVQGPVPTGELVAMAQAGRLGVHDKVRLGAAGQWLEAGSVEGLFSQAGGRTAAEAAADVLARGSRPDLQRGGQPARPRPAAARLPSLSLDPLINCASAGLQRIIELAAWLLSRALRSYLSVAGLALVLAVVLARQIPVPQSTRNRGDFERVSKLYAEFKDQRARKAGKADWTEFSARSERELAPLRDSLARTAGVRDRASQQLLWAVRDSFPAMLNDARETVSDAERRFDQHLANAEAILRGDRVFSSPEDSQFAASRPQPTRPAADDWLLWSVLAADAAILVAGVGFWIWKR